MCQRCCVRGCLLFLLPFACVAFLLATLFGFDYTTIENRQSVDLSDVTIESYPSVDGSTSTHPLATLIACKILDVRCGWITNFDLVRTIQPLPEATSPTYLPIHHSGTHGAYVNLIEGTTDLILVARVPSDDEWRLAREKGVRLQVRPFARDAFVFIAHESNPIHGLTVQQIREIYTGQITHWNQVGGADLAIHPYRRNQNSGSEELMKDLVLKELTPIDLPELTQPSMVSIITSVAQDELGLGYSVYYYEENMAPSDGVKLLGVDGLKPDPQTIQSGDYPFTTDVYAVIRDDLDHDTRAYELWRWLFSIEGQEVVAESGYVPLRR